MWGAFILVFGVALAVLDFVVSSKSVQRRQMAVEKADVSDAWDEAAHRLGGERRAGQALPGIVATRIPRGEIKSDLTADVDGVRVQARLVVAPEYQTSGRAVSGMRAAVKLHPEVVCTEVLATPDLPFARFFTVL